MLAVSAWTWIVAAALVLGALGFLARVTLGLVGRLKALNRSLQGVSGQLNEMMEQMRGDLDRTTRGLGALRERREQQGGRPGPISAGHSRTSGD